MFSSIRNCSSYVIKVERIFPLRNRYLEVSLTNQKSMMLLHVFFTLHCIQAFQEGWCIAYNITDEPLFCMGTCGRRFRRLFFIKTSVFWTKLLHQNTFSAR